LNATKRLLGTDTPQSRYMPMQLPAKTSAKLSESTRKDVHDRIEALVAKCGRLAALLLLGSSKTRRNSRWPATFIQTHSLLRLSRMAALPCLLDNTSSPNRERFWLPLNG
jgi:hypothetical protein